MNLSQRLTKDAPVNGNGQPNRLTGDANGASGQPLYQEMKARLQRQAGTGQRGIQRQRSRRARDRTDCFFRRPAN